MGLGSYKLHSTSNEDQRRVSQAFEYRAPPYLEGQPTSPVSVRATAGCDVGFSLLSNEHLLDEVDRLRGHNGVLAGPGCKACGRPYLQARMSSSVKGANGSTGIRLIHRPCRKKPGGRFTISLDHSARATAENVQILQALVNGAGVNDLVRMLRHREAVAPAASAGSMIGSSGFRSVLLAFEREQLRRWQEENDAQANASTSPRSRRHRPQRQLGDPRGSADHPAQLLGHRRRPERIRLSDRRRFRSDRRSGSFFKSSYLDAPAGRPSSDKPTWEVRTTVHASADELSASERTARRAAVLRRGRRAA